MLICFPSLPMLAIIFVVRPAASSHQRDPLADMLEDFIRGLVNEEDYEPDPEKEKAEERLKEMGA